MIEAVISGDVVLFTNFNNEGRALIVNAANKLRCYEIRANMVGQ